MEIAMLVLAAIGVLAAIIAALPPLGVDVRIFGRPHMPLEGVPYFRARQAWIAMVVALISLSISAGAFYYFFHPRVRVEEKIIEKPVDRIIEKPCPTPAIVAPISPAQSNKRTKPAGSASVSDKGPTYRVENPTGSIVNQDSTNLGTQTVNNGPPPLKLEYSFQTLASGEQGTFNFDILKCHVRTHMRVVPNQAVPPPIRIALDFDYPVSNIGTTVENVGAISGGGPFTLGLHVISSPISSPGISPNHPLIVEVCSDVPVKLIGEPHLAD